ncbi:MAG: GNAT family N-acetyltransferase [Rhodocyclales bacterium]|nr:GNAT family N-acetyltransferase [Rhodocyclales bacterium]
MALHQAPLQPFVAPGSIALFGASPDPRSLGYGLVRNLVDGGYAGALHLISNRHASIHGIDCHASLDSIGSPITLALIATPAETVADIVEACEQRGIEAAVIYSAFADNAMGLSARLRAVADRGKLRVLGPRAFGYILPHSGLNLTPFARSVPRGNLALVAQSAALCAHVLDWRHTGEFGYSAVFAPGASSDIELPEILDHLARDTHTHSILLYIEGLHDARRFLSAARAAASIKPVIAIKAGRTPASARLAALHCDAPAGRDDAFDAALRRAGVLRVNTVGEMFSAARALTTPKMPRGGRLAIVCNGGGPAVIAADQAGVCDVALANLAPATLARIGQSRQVATCTPATVDLMFDATPADFSGAIEACADDPGVDCVLVIFAPTSYADPLGVAHATIGVAQQAKKPVLACWLGEQQTHGAHAEFARSRVPVFRTPENAVTAFAFMATWVRSQELLRETPTALSGYTEPNTATALAIIDDALRACRDRLTLPEAKAVLTAFHIPVTPTRIAHTPAEAAAIGDELGYPLTMKAAALAGTRAAPAQIRPHLRSAPELILALRELTTQKGASGAVHIEPHVDKSSGRELSIAIRPDDLLGPVITLSEAGLAPEIYDARSISLPPLNPRLVNEMLAIPYVARLLGPMQDKPAVALEPLSDILLRISELASELPSVHALEIGSLIADAHGAVVVDVSIEVRPLLPEHERYRHMAICPYPARLARDVTLKDGSTCLIRPIRPEDGELMQAFVRNLSARSKRFRYFSTLQELPRYELARITQIDYGRELTLVATVLHDTQTHMIGEAHYSTLLDEQTCEFAVVIADDQAGKGLGTQLMRGLMEAAREQGLRSIRGLVMADNEPMLALMESLDFIVYLTDDENEVEVARDLD